MVADAPTSAAGASIRVRNVSKRFEAGAGTVTALDAIELSIAPGEFVSLIGPSGCGKSTLLRVINGLLDSDSGEVRVGDETPLQARRAKHFGFVPQTPALLPWRSVLDNVTLLCEVNRRGMRRTPDAMGLLHSVGLERFARSLPRELSGGMQQRVSLVRAFALGPPILLMDEPFAALDEITRADMRYLLLDLWQRTGTTVVFVTHSIDEAVILSDRVVVMAASPGRIRAVEPIALPRPRHEALEDSTAFHDHVATVRRELKAGWTR